jgi:hypothetical protein
VTARLRKVEAETFAWLRTYYGKAIVDLGATNGR